MRAIFVLIAALGLCLAQQAGTSTAETHPPLITAVCSSSGCTNYTKSVTMDANWRWLHNTGGYTNCYSGNTWSTTYCTDPDTCASSCALDGCAYSGTYGVTSSGTQLRLNFVTGSNVGSRLYLMATNSNTSYEMFKLLNKEFTFDVDVSQLACGLNGALYFVEMDETGNLGVGNNKAGAFYGTGYCDAQCPHDVKFIKGQANIINWTTTSTNSGKGKYGSCCGEMDIWEANKMSTAYTAHNCLYSGLYRCSNSTDCGDSSNRYKGVCDKDGCDWNHYRMGNTDFYGESKTVDTTSKFTVVTQFVTDDGTSSGNLVEIRRYYKQNGVVIANSFSTWSALSSYDSLTDASCVAAKTLFGDTDDFTAKGGMTTHGKMLSRGVVLVLSLWDDYDAYMLWLDSNYPTTGSASTPGVARGSCSTSSGVPSSVESTYSSAYVIFSNIRVGDFGTTASGVPVPGTSSTATPATAESSTTVSPTVVSSTVSPVVESSAVVSSASEVSSAENSASSVAVGIASILALAMTIVA